MVIEVWFICCSLPEEPTGKDLLVFILAVERKTFMSV